MANIKITALTEYSSLDANDLIPIVDVSDTAMNTSGTDKKAKLTDLVFKASGTDHGPGMAPDPGASSGTTKFLREDSSWAVPPGTYSDPIFVASGSSHAAGDVPDPGSTAGTTRFLREDATWQVPPGSSGIIYCQTASVSVTTTDDTSFVNTTGSIGSVVLASGYLVAGKSLRFRFGGYYLTSGTTGNWKIGVFFGSTCIATSMVGPPDANLGSSPWAGEILVVCTVGGGAGSSAVWASGFITMHAAVPIITGHYGVGPATSFGTVTSGTAVSPNLSTGITLDLKANSSGTMTFQNWTLTHLIIESLG